MDDTCNSRVADFMKVCESLILVNILSLSRYVFQSDFKLFEVIIACPFLPESFRWYLSKGKFEKGKKAVSNYAAHCDVEIPKESLERMVKPV